MLNTVDLNEDLDLAIANFKVRHRKEVEDLIRFTPLQNDFPKTYNKILHRIEIFEMCIERLTLRKMKCKR